MNLFSENQEVYMRIRNSYYTTIKNGKPVRNSERILELRNHPLVPRPDARLKIPRLDGTYDRIAWILLLIYVCGDNDYIIAQHLQTFINQAKMHNYQGSEGIWKKMADYFCLPIENGERSKEIFSLNLNSNEIEGTIFDPYYFVEFLLNYFCSEDDIFGTLVPKMQKLTSQLKFETYQQYYYRQQRQAVKRAKRPRGYKDKGSLAPESRKDPNRFIQDNKERIPNASYDVLDQVRTWGISPKQSEDFYIPEE